MSDFKTQRNVAIGVAAVALAFVAGYLIPNRSPEPGTTPAAAAAPVAEPAPGADRAPLATGAAAPSTASVSEAAAAAPTVGRRRPNRPSTASDPGVESRAEESSEVAAEAAPATSEEPRASAPTRVVERVTIPQSTPIVLELLQGVSSQTAQVGDEVVAELAEPIRVDGAIVVPAGTRVTGRVSEAQALRKVGGKAILGLSFDRLESGDGGAAIAAAFRREGKSETGKDAATIAAGAAIGTILGNQSRKNDRGKLIGAVVGAAAGTAVAANTEGERVELPAGARLELTLRSEVEVLADR